MLQYTNRYTSIPSRLLFAKPGMTIRKISMKFIYLPHSLTRKMRPRLEGKMDVLPEVILNAIRRTGVKVGLGGFGRVVEHSK